MIVIILIYNSFYMFCMPDIRKSIRAVDFLVKYILRFWNRIFFSKLLFQFKFVASFPTC